jgi:hypothetical protein
VGTAQDSLGRTTGTGNSNTQGVVKNDNTNHGVEAQKLERVQAIATIMTVVKEQDIIQRKSRIQATREKKVQRDRKRIE